MLVAQKMMLQLAERDIRHLTDVEPQPHRTHEGATGMPRRVSRPVGRVWYRVSLTSADAPYRHSMAMRKWLWLNWLSG